MEIKDIKKGQISIFIIIGIILVIVMAFLVYNSDVEFFMSHDTKLKNQISDIVEDCIYKHTSTGVFLLGQQGGYIEIPTLVSLDPKRHIDFGTKIPNWDTKEGNIPTINSMQIELENYVNDRAYSCINTNLAALKNTFDMRYDGNFTLDATINDQNVIVQASYPITFNEKNSDEILNIDEYVVQLDETRLGDMYKLAVSIYNTELQSQFFEELTLDQIHSANDYSSTYSMPSEGMSITCGKRVWTYPQLKRNLANMNNNNFKYLQFEGTYSKDDIKETNLGYNNQTESYKAYFDNIYNVDLYKTLPTFINYDVNVFMPSTEVTSAEGILERYPFRTFEVTPNSGQITKSIDMQIDMGGSIPIPCIQFFHHLYTLDYDLVVRLEDRTDDNGFIFQFPIRVEIYNNEPKDEQYSLITDTQDQTTFNQESYCSDNVMQYPVMVTTKDINDNPISDVNISYKCISITCDMGTTEKPNYNGVERIYATPQLVTDFPFCIGGKVIAEKEGYHALTKRIDTTDDLLNREVFAGANLVELELTPLKTFPINTPENFLIIKKETGQGLRVLSEDDGSILVNIENKGLDFTSQAIWPNDGDYFNEIELLDDTINYNLTVYYMDSSYQLKGLLEIPDWTPDVNAGNQIQFVIPGSGSEITEDNYIEFYEYASENSGVGKFDPKIY